MDSTQTPTSIIIIIIIIMLHLEIFPPVLPDSLSQEFDWQQIFPSLQNSSQYSGGYCSLDGLQLSSDFNIFPSLYQSFGDCSKCTNYNCYHRHLHV